MAHVEDRWEKTVDGVKVRTDRFGSGKRWRALPRCGRPRALAGVRPQARRGEVFGDGHRRRVAGCLCGTPEVSGADVAESSYTAFSGKDALTVRLVVRQVRPTPGSQLALFTAWDYHAFVTNRPGDVLQIEADHRRHAVVERRIAELESAGLAHLPSGRFMANATWLALTVMAHNLSRAVGRLAENDLQRATPSARAPAAGHDQ